MPEFAYTRDVLDDMTDGILFEEARARAQRFSRKDKPSRTQVRGLFHLSQNAPDDLYKVAEKHAGRSSLSAEAQGLWKKVCETIGRLEAPSAQGAWSLSAQVLADRERGAGVALGDLSRAERKQARSELRRERSRLITRFFRHFCLFILEKIATGEGE